MLLPRAESGGAVCVNLPKLLKLSRNRKFVLRTGPGNLRG